MCQRHPRHLCFSDAARFGPLRTTTPPPAPPAEMPKAEGTKSEGLHNMNNIRAGRYVVIDRRVRNEWGIRPYFSDRTFARFFAEELHVVSTIQIRQGRSS